MAAHGLDGSFLDRPINPGDMPILAPEANGVDSLLGTERYVGDYELLAELARGVGQGAASNTQTHAR